METLQPSKSTQNRLERLCSKMADNETKNGFEGEHFFLSNFYPAPTTAEIAGVEGSFLTGEHLFQAYKSLFALPGQDKQVWVKQFLDAKTPGKAKYVGRSIRIDVTGWDNFAVTAMKKNIFAKFNQHDDLREQLVATGDLVLIEYNDWNDTIWGVSKKTGKGKNQLGELLMRLRNYYKQNS